VAFWKVGCVVGVTVGGTVGVLVPPGVGVFVGVEVGPAVLVCEAVGVFVALPEVTITNSGAFAPSRLEKLMFVLLVVLRANAYVPFPVLGDPR
jgi:hypothetical protein